MQNRAIRSLCSLSMSFALAVGFGINVANAESNNSDNWHGPGWYQIIFLDLKEDGAVDMIEAGPYSAKQSCVDHVSAMISDVPHMTDMLHKWGRYGVDWGYICRQYDKKSDVPDD